MIKDKRLSKDKRMSDVNSIDYFNQYYRTPEDITTKESFKRFLYNRKTGEVFGRTGSSWSKILIFYTIFYGVLAVLVAICMWVFFQTLDPRTPTWQLDESRIGTNPGLGFRPLPPEEQAESTLIWYKGTDKNYAYWVKALDDFLEVYTTPGLLPGRGQNTNDCGYDKLPNKGQVCNVDVKSWKPCNKENFYNYHRSSPCIFLKLNKIYGWIPEYYNSTRDLPDEMPQDLKDHIANLEKQNSKELNTVWVSCEGENPADVENVGSIKYIPSRGFPGYFYPYENSEGYLSPLVAINLERPTAGILINIECKAWARNIIHNRKERLGSVHFELMID